MNLMCSNKTIKYLMFVFNFIFVITGIIILAMGVSVKAHYYPYDTFLDDKYFSLPNMLIATGSLIFIISFLGCYGAIRENWLMLMAFSILLAIIFIFELSVGIAGYALRDKTSSYLESKLTETMQKYESSPAISSMWDLIQEEFQCCGVYNSSDWQNIFSNSSLPVSCCPTVSGTVGQFYCNGYTTVPTPTTTTKDTPTEATTPTTPTTVSTTTTPKSNDDPSNGAIQSGSLVKADENDTTTTTGEATTPSAASETTTTTQTTKTIATSPTVTESTATASTSGPISDTTTEVTKSTITIQTTQTTKESTSATKATTNVPPSTAYPNSTSTPYTAGCEAAFGNFLRAHAVDIGGVGIALAVIQLFGIFFAFHLARQLKNGYYST